MTQKERIEAVYCGETPDCVPYMLDLSHWFYHRNRKPWDLSRSYEQPERELIEYARDKGVGFYMPNLGHFYDVAYPDSVRASVTKDAAGRSITWRLETARGTVKRTRVWDETSYSWAIRDWGIRTEEQARILADALAERTYRFRPAKYRAWVETIGDQGVCYVSPGYSAMGRLLGAWMGIEGTTYATVDWPDTLHEVVDRINANQLALVDELAASPAPFICMGDNFSSDVQPPHFFAEWSRPFYTEAIRRLHAAGKKVAVHVDGRLAGAIGMIRDVGADCIDAVTPRPMGDLDAEQCRDEAGPDLILSGGVSPDLWLPGVPVEVFKEYVRKWLDLRQRSPRLIANAGDQVPPGADEDRIEIMRDLVAEHGRY